MSAHGEAGTLAIARAGHIDEKEHLSNIAKKRFLAEPHCEVIVMGHTHQPDSRKFDGRRYYNPGSWTRYLDISKQERLTLEMLKNEARFPYELSYISVQQSSDRLLSEKKTFEQHPGETP